MIIGLTGTLAAGKGIVSDFLKKQGFVYLSLSDELREIVRQRKIQVTRENLQNIGNELRNQEGAGILAKLVKEKILTQQYRNAIVDGIRNPAEIKVLRDIKNFFLVVVDAPREIRFKRMVERNRESDPKEWEDFLKVDARDQEEADEKGQQVRKCMEQADFILTNDRTLEEAEQKVIKLYEQIQLTIKEKNSVKKRKDYLSWDEYFMGIALLSAQRSKDPNTQVGACIVTPNKKIVGTGYNGFPIGCSDDNLPWTREGEFLDTKYPYVCHAELNAILNSTKNLNNCIIYVALFPCNECAKAIIQSGIKEVVYLFDKYADLDITKAAKKMFNQAGIRQRQLFINKDFLKINFKD